MEVVWQLRGKCLTLLVMTVNVLGVLYLLSNVGFAWMEAVTVDKAS